MPRNDKIACKHDVATQLKRKKQNRFFVDHKYNVHSFERRQKLNLVNNSILGKEVSKTIGVLLHDIAIPEFKIEI
jgi:hypothetical protein